MGFSYQTTANEIYLLGDLNQNAANNFYILQTRKWEAETVPPFTKIQNGQAYPVWNWSDFEE